MATALVSAIMSVLLVTAVMVGFSAAYDIQAGWSGAWRSTQRLAGERTRTALQLTSAQSSADRSTITVALQNTGGIDILPLAKMDLIVEYTAAGAQRKEWLAYGRWSIDGIVPDSFQPGSWSPGETLTLTIRLPAPADGDTQGAVVVGTPNGVTVSGYVQFPPDPPPDDPNEPEPA